MDDIKKKLAIDKFWCPYPFHFLMIAPNLEVRPCCRYRDSSSGANLQLDSLAGINSTFEGSEIKKIQKSMLNGIVPKGCVACKQEEDKGIYSLRQKTIFENQLPLNSEATITAMEIGVGRLCNLKCRICNSQYSSKWDSDEREMGVTNRNYTLDTEINLETCPEQLFETVTDLKITGGEPFLSKSFSIFLEKFDKTGFNKNCKIEIFTNATIFPSNKVIELLSRFKHTRISISLDALTTKNDYIRHPSKWGSLQKNLVKWRGWKNLSESNDIWIANTVNILNISSSIEFMSWANTFFGDSIKIVFQLLYSPIHLSVFNAPNSLKKIIRKHLDDQLLGEYKHLDNKKNKKNFEKLFNLLKSGKAMSNFIDYFYDETEALDKIRNEKFNEVFPDLDSWLRLCKKN